MGRATECEWRGTAARGVYKPVCLHGGTVMGVPPKPGTPCPHCERPVAQPHKPAPGKKGDEQ